MNILNTDIGKFLKVYKSDNINKSLVFNSNLDNIAYKYVLILIITPDISNNGLYKITDISLAPIKYLISIAIIININN